MSEFRRIYTMPHKDSILKCRLRVVRLRVRDPRPREEIDLPHIMLQDSTLKQHPKRHQISGHKGETLGPHRGTLEGIWSLI